MVHRTLNALADSHCHLDFSCFDVERDSILDACGSLGITTIVMPGTQASAWLKQIELTKHYKQLKYSLGLHPYFLQDFCPEDMTLLSELLRQHQQQVVALGEIGLDAEIDVDWQLQVDVFTCQLRLAKSQALPVILHHRNSHNELIRILKKERFHQGGIIHAFSGSIQQANTYIELGFKIGVGGSITYPRAVKTRKTIAQLPLSSLVLETDSPDMPIMGKQGQNNSPVNLIYILDALADIRCEPRPLIINALYNNTQSALINL